MIIKIKINMAAIETGSENTSMPDGIVSLVRSDGIPITTNPLKILEPIIFPTANSGLPLFTAAIVTSTSGREVPRAMAERAIISLPIPKKADMKITESTEYLAPKNIPIGLKRMISISLTPGFCFFLPGVFFLEPFFNI